MSSDLLFAQSSTLCTISQKRRLSDTPRSLSRARQIETRLRAWADAQKLISNLPTAALTSHDRYRASTGALKAICRQFQRSETFRKYDSICSVITWSKIAVSCDQPSRDHVIGTWVTVRALQHARHGTRMTGYRGIQMSIYVDIWHLACIFKKVNYTGDFSVLGRFVLRCRTVKRK